ncbi:MAG: tRNA pseudouridine(38-40) synthase TruA [Cyclobacteriaceae bacterium]|nr:tRNA pseudouridine(38-40) synthase TruA [Cyclobacteriaceae bacterium]
MKYFFHIGYHGNRYRGWQRQPGVANVQEVIEDALFNILKTPVSIIGCGRTDAQVHAIQFFFHAEIDQAWDYDLVFRLNKRLPIDIAVFEIIPVQDDQHARYDATQRTYDYFIHTYKDPFLSEVSSLYLEPHLDLEKMKDASKLFTRYDDFMALCKAPARYKHTRCHVTEATLFTDATGDKLRFRISANRFLGRMVRMIMGTLLEVGRKQMSVDALENYLITRQTPENLKPAYPQGLFLSKVTYPYLDIPPRTERLGRLQYLTEDWVPV